MSYKIKAVSTKDGKEVGERINLGDDFIKIGKITCMTNFILS